MTTIVINGKIDLKILLLVVLDMLLLLFVYFLGVNAMIWTRQQILELYDKACDICLQKSHLEVIK